MAEAAYFITGKSVLQGGARPLNSLSEFVPKTLSVAQAWRNHKPLIFGLVLPRQRLTF
jgi:hypothetical protein